MTRANSSRACAQLLEALRRRPLCNIALPPVGKIGDHVGGLERLLPEQGEQRRDLPTQLSALCFERGDCFVALCLLAVLHHGDHACEHVRLRRAVIAKSPRLQQEIKQVLSEGNKKQEDVTCVGMRFPGQWKHLGGLRVSPYVCVFGAMWLQIRATVRISDGRGQSFEAITDKAMNNATNVSETNLNWKWTTECSPQSVPGWCS